MDMHTTLPRARNEQLVIQALPEETLVYDLKRHKAHCLNKTAAFVWQHCDGQTTTSEMAEKLSTTFQLPADEKIVWLALGDLEKANLLQGSVARDNGFIPGRRAALKRIGLVGASAVLIPTIVSIVAPTVSAVVTTCAPATCPGGTSAECAQPCTCVGTDCVDLSGRDGGTATPPRF